MTSRPPAGSGQIICSRERTNHVLPTVSGRLTCPRDRVRLACPRPIQRRQGEADGVEVPKPAKSKVEAKPSAARKSREGRWLQGPRPREAPGGGDWGVKEEAQEQQAATAEILRVISSSPADAQPVFNAIAVNALRLCDAKGAVVVRYDGELLPRCRPAQCESRSRRALPASVPSGSRSPLYNGPSGPRRGSRSRARPPSRGGVLGVGRTSVRRGKQHLNPAPPPGPRHRGDRNLRGRGVVPSPMRRSNCSRPSPTRRSSRSRTCGCSRSWRRATAI